MRATFHEKPSVLAIGMRGRTDGRAMGGHASGEPPPPYTPANCFLNSSTNRIRAHTTSQFYSLGGKGIFRVTKNKFAHAYKRYISNCVFNFKEMNIVMCMFLCVIRVFSEINNTSHWSVPLNNIHVIIINHERKFSCLINVYQISISIRQHFNLQ